VYLGEYASWGNSLFNAIAEAAYMTSLERNGDVVRLSSYAPLLAKAGHTQWNPDMIYFSNTTIYRTVNYYVQQLFSTNEGDVYHSNVVTPATNKTDSALAFSCVRNTKTGDVIIKLVNSAKVEKTFKVDLSQFKEIGTKANVSILTGAADAKNSFENPDKVKPVTSDFKAAKNFTYTVQPMSLTVIRVKSN
jgi:alpha-L-arabinofuranosidase